MRDGARQTKLRHKASAHACKEPGSSGHKDAQRGRHDYPGFADRISGMKSTLLLSRAWEGGVRCWWPIFLLVLLAVLS